MERLNRGGVLLYILGYTTYAVLSFLFWYALMLWPTGIFKKCLNIVHDIKQNIHIMDNK